MQINRVLPPESRGAGGRARVVVAVGADQFVGGVVPAVPMAPGDSVTALSVPTRQRGYVTVKGNVWVEGQVGFAPGMKLSDAIRLAGGPRPDVYLPRVLVTRVRDDSSLVQLRSVRSSTRPEKSSEDMALQDEDEIRLFSRTTFRPAPMVAIVGAVRRPGRVPYREGMTVRDAILLADGLTEDAQLHVEVARLPADRPTGALAQTIEVSLDSTYLFARRGTDGVGGAAPKRAGRHTAPAVRQRAGAPSGGLGSPAHRGHRGSGEGTGSVRPPDQDRAVERDLLDRAGGLTSEAYAGGIQFYRAYDGSRPTGTDQLPSTLDGEVPAGQPRGATDLRARRHRSTARARAIRRTATTSSSPAATRSTSRSSIPVVIVQGAVNSPGAVAYTPGKNLDWYVNAAGGYTQAGDARHPYVTQPDGQREGVKRRSVFADRCRRLAPARWCSCRRGPRPSRRVPTRPPSSRPSRTLLGSLATIILVARTRTN